MNHSAIGLAAVLALAPVVTTRLADATPPAAHRQQADWNWHGRIAAGKTVAIRGVNGRVAAEPGSGTEVLVTATKRAHRHGDPDDVKIEVVEHDGSVTICAVYPGRSNRCGPDDDYHMSTHDNDVEVEFHVQLPAGVAFDGSTVNGDVEATDLTGKVEANTVNGGVRIETSAGDARGETVNGSVTAVLHGQGTTPLSFKTVNGGVTLSVPKDLNADLEAETVNGSIDTDFPITVTGRINRRHLDGRIGQGGRSLKIETVNGSIRLRAL
jgi:Putative adhesin